MGVVSPFGSEYRGEGAREMPFATPEDQDDKDEEPTHLLVLVEVPLVHF